MKAKHIKHLLLIPIVAVAVAGCSSAPSRFYTLSSTATGDGAPAANYAVAVGPVSLPALVDRPQFTVQVATNQVDARRVQPVGRAIERQHRPRRSRRPGRAAGDAARGHVAVRKLRGCLPGDHRRPAIRVISERGEAERRGARRGGVGGPQGGRHRRGVGPARSCVSRPRVRITSTRRRS